MSYLDKYKREVAYYMKRLCRKDLTTSSGGNISFMVGNKILITPSGTDKSIMSSDDIVAVDSTGKITESEKGFAPSIEYKFHLMIYKIRKDVSAVVHSHPVYASALAASSFEINNRLLAESYAILGKIQYVPFDIMGTHELAENIRKAAAKADCIVMRNHGVITLGKDLFQAFDRMEVAENAAKLTVIHHGLPQNSSVELNEEELAGIDKIMGR